MRIIWALCNSVSNEGVFWVYILGVYIAKVVCNICEFDCFKCAVSLKSFSWNIFFAVDLFYYLSKHIYFTEVNEIVHKGFVHGTIYITFYRWSTYIKMCIWVSLHVLSKNMIYEFIHNLTIIFLPCLYHIQSEIPRSTTRHTSSF